MDPDEPKIVKAHGTSASAFPSSQGARHGLIGNLVGRVAPAVMRQIDTNDLVDALDVNVIAAGLDIDSLIERIDVNAIAQRIDIDSLVERIDVNAIAQRIDIDSLVERLDVIALADRIDMARLTAGATQDVAVSGLDLVRRQIVRADATVDGLTDRVLRRKPGTRPIAPGKLAERSGAETAEHASESGKLQRRDVSGHYAGPVTRILAVAGDLVALSAAAAGLAWVVFLFIGVVAGADRSFGAASWLSVILPAIFFVGWFWIPVTLFGRTLAMALLGIAVVRRDGGIAGGRRALIRALVLPVSLLIPVSFVGLALGKERRALHDVASGTVVIYDWGERDAEQPVTIREQLSARVRRRQVERT